RTVVIVFGPGKPADSRRRPARANRRSRAGRPDGSPCGTQCVQVQAYSAFEHSGQWERLRLKRSTAGLASGAGLICTTVGWLLPAGSAASEINVSPSRVKVRRTGAERSPVVTITTWPE